MNSLFFYAYRIYVYKTDKVFIIFKSHPPFIFMSTVQDLKKQEAQQKLLI